jgi:ribosome-associated protein
VTAIPRNTRTKTPRRKSKISPAQTLLARAEKILEDGKAEDLVAIDLHGKSDIADYLLIATGRSQRQIMALAQRLLDGLKAAGHGKIAIEGLRHGDWVLIDAGDVIVHLFKPESRSYYNLEKMWGEALSEAVGQS